MAKVHDKEKSLHREIANRVETAMPDVEVLAVELNGPERFTVFIDRVGTGVDHALCARVTDELRDYLREYTIDVSSPGIERPLRKPEHFRSAVGRHVTLRTEARKRLRGEVVDAERPGLDPEDRQRSRGGHLRGDPAREPDGREVSKR